MLEIILLILKIIGITALSLLGVIVLVLLLVLFVPIRYKISSTNEVDGDIEARGTVSWLLHFIHVKAEYKKELSYYVKVFGFKIYPKNEKKKESKQTDKRKKSDTRSQNTDKELEISMKESKEKSVKKVKVPSEERSSDEKNKFTFRGLYDKIKETFSKIKKNIDLINEESTKRAIVLCKGELIHIIKVIFPRNIRGVLKLGLENPALTGEIYGGYCALYPIHKGNIVMIPCFEEEVFEYRVIAVGRIRIITLIIIAVKIYFNKDIQRLIKIFNKEEE